MVWVTRECMAAQCRSQDRSILNATCQSAPLDTGHLFCGRLIGLSVRNRPVLKRRRVVFTFLPQQRSTKNSNSTRFRPFPTELGAVRFCFLSAEDRSRHGLKPDFFCERRHQTHYWTPCALHSFMNHQTRTPALLPSCMPPPDACLCSVHGAPCRSSSRFSSAWVCWWHRSHPSPR